VFVVLFIIRLAIKKRFLRFVIFFLSTLKRTRNYTSLFGLRRCRVGWWVGGKVTGEKTVLDVVVVTCMEAGPPLPPPP